MSDAVRRMFADVAPRYDRTNGVLSLGLHHRWRRRAVRWAAPSEGDRVLDVATGTGDLAFAFARAVGPTGHVVGVDFCPPMIGVAKTKKGPRGAAVDFQEGDALALGFADGSFDVASIGFGVRNVDDPRRCVAEMARVVRPGGRVVVLEFGQPRGLLRWPYRFYSRVVVPLVGGWLTGHRDAYRYLEKTSAAFPSGERFIELMRSTGRFSDVRAASLSGDIAFAYVGTVAPAPIR